MLSQQRDRSYEELSALEGKDATLREQFKQSTSALSKRRITSQLLQFRKDMERRQQFLAISNQQINVVSTHLHNLELVQQGQSAKLPDSDALAEDATKAEEMIAELQADNELAGSVSELAHAGLSEEEQALYDELESETAGSEKGTQINLERIEEQRVSAPARRESDGGREAQRDGAAPSPAPRRSEPEAG
jgi:hypothetical protein